MSYKNNVISSDDPQAIEQLTEKLNACKENQEFISYSERFRTFLPYGRIFTVLLILF